MKTNKNTSPKSKVQSPKEEHAAETAALPGVQGEFKVLARSHVRPDPNQPRKVFDETKLAALCESIKAQGIVQPILVRWVEPELKIHEPDLHLKTWEAVDRAGATVFSGDEEVVRKFADGKTEGFYQIVDGECRWRAADLAGMANIPCVVRSMADREVFNAQWTSNQQRSNLTALEEGASFERQIEERKQTDPSFNPEKLAEELGIARGTIYNRLKLVRLHGPVRLALEAGTIDPTVAGEISIIPSREDQEEMLGVIRESSQAGQQFSFREVRDYIQNNYAKQLADAQFDVKEENYFPQGTCGDNDIFLGPCTKCPNRSGNMKEMFPDIKNPHVCTVPKCFAEKHKAHQAKLAQDHRDKGSEVISRDEYFDRADDLVQAEDGGMQVGTRWMGVSQIVGKKKLKGVMVQNGSSFEKYFLKVDVKAAGEANGLDFTPPKPKPQPKAVEAPKPKETPVKPTTPVDEHDWEKTDLMSGAETNYECKKCGAKGVRYGVTWPPKTKAKSCEMSDEAKEKFIAQQREREEAAEKARQKEEERRRKEHEKEVARQELMERVVKGALQELQVVVEKRPVNGKSESEFWQFLCEQRAFLEQFIFWSSHLTVFERRGLKGEPKKVVGKMDYAEFRSVILEQFLNGDSPAFDGMGLSDELKQACKFFGVDLKKIEREASDKNGELAGMPEPKVKKKGKKK
jgi:ParB/RepB/Spo0J family partition protein